MNEDHTIRVIAFCEGDKWVAQCLEYDIGAQGDDLDKAKLYFSLALDAEVAESIKRHGTPFAGIPAAPAHFLDMWEKRTNAFEPATMHSDGVDVQLALVA